LRATGVKAVATIKARHIFSRQAAAKAHMVTGTWIALKTSCACAPIVKNRCIIVLAVRKEGCVGFRTDPAITTIATIIAPIMYCTLVPNKLYRNHFGDNAFCAGI
jgi:hypothetical protein